MQRISLGTLLLALTVFAGCHSAQPAGQATASTAASPNFKVYKLHGKVVSTNSATGEVTLNHDAIPGFMDAMTMPYKLKDPSILTELHAGDIINADVLVSQGNDATVLIDHVVVVAQARPDYKPTTLYHVPSSGDAVPDFKLTNEEGRTIHLDQFRGKALLITFIYTRCPLPDFCPLVTRHFAEIDNRLAADPALYAQTHLLSVSFDPRHDTPAVLRAYGESYIGGKARREFAHWDFAVPSRPELLEMAKYFDVGITPGPGDTVNHTLSTTLIDPRGKVVQFYPGNEWTPDQVLSDLKHIQKAAS